MPLPRAQPGTTSSAFAGLSAGTPFYDGLLGIAMWVGRFFVIVPVLAIAGSLAAKRHIPGRRRVVPHDRRPCGSAFWSESS